MSLAQDTAGLTGAGVIKMTELVSKQMATVGMTTQETSAFLTQFGQAMSSGRLQGDEFRSMMETNVPMMKMLADSMGVTIGELKNLGSEGKITAKDLTDAFLGSTAQIEKAAAQIDMTIGKAFTVLKNNAMQAFNEMESGSLVVKGITEAILLLANNLTEAIRLAIAFVVALAVSKLASIASGVGGITTAFDKLNKTIRANVFVAVLTAIVYIGEKIYSDMIKPLKDFGVSSGVIGRYVAENLINAFLQVGEAAISVFPAIGKLIADALTPGKSVSESLKEIDGIYAKILSRRTVKLVSDEELKTINGVLNTQKQVNTAVQQEANLRKEAQIALSQQQKDAQKALDAYIAGLKRSAAEQQDLVLYGKREAEVRKAIQEQQDKLAVLGMSLTKNQRDQITNAIRLKQEYEDIATTQQAFRTVAQQITLNTIEDVRQRQIQSGLLQYQATVSKEIYAANSANYESLLKQAQLTDDLNQYKVAIRDIDNEIANIQIRDVREREIQNELTQYQLQLGREVYAITGKQLEAKVRERSLQRLINEELGKARNLTLGTFGNLAAEIKKTEEAYAGARKEAARVWKEISKGKDMDEALAKNQRDRMLLERSANIQNLQLMAEKNRLTGFYGAEAFALHRIEIEQIEALRETDLISYTDYLSAKTAATQRYLDAETEATRKTIEYQTRLRLANDNNMMGGIRLTTDEQKKIAAERADFEMKTDYQKTQFALENSATIFNALGAQNKKAFEAAKALNIAVAIMNTYRAATIALATYPPPFNFIAMAASIATGLAQVAAIRSQTYSGRALGGGVMGGGSYIVGERGPEIFTPATNGSITSNRELASGGATTNVNFTIVANDTRGFDELLTQRRGLITQIIGDAQLEKGRRL
jgi:hypothetical protein